MRATKLITTFALAAIAGLAAIIAFGPTPAGAVPAIRGPRAAGAITPGLGEAQVIKKSLDEVKFVRGNKAEDPAKAKRHVDAPKEAEVLYQARVIGAASGNKRATAGHKDTVHDLARDATVLPRTLNGHGQVSELQERDYCTTCDCEESTCHTGCPKCGDAPVPRTHTSARDATALKSHGQASELQKRDYCTTCDCEESTCHTGCPKCGDASVPRTLHYQGQAAGIH